MEDLFLDIDLGFEKTAARGVDLGENAEEWDAEILKEAYRQVPYLSDYDVSVILDKKDGDKGYAFGHLSLTNKSGTPIMVGSSSAPLQSDLSKEAKVPLIVKEGSLRPLKVFVNEGSFEPLTERRLGSALFRADLATGTASPSESRSLAEKLYPPYRAGHGSVTGSGASIKQASVLEKIASTISINKREALLDKIRNDPAVLHAVDNNDSFSKAIDKISKAEPISAEKAKEAVQSSLHPDVVQVSKGTGFYKMKTASASMYNPIETSLSRDEVLEHFGQDVLDRVNEDGFMTASRSFTPEDESVPMQDVTSFGRYRVKQASGAWSEGWVYPHVVDLDMNLQGTTLYTDGMGGAIQEKVAGYPVEGDVHPAGHAIKGTGSFVAGYDDKAVATMPVTILNHVRSEDESFYRAETMEGRKVKIATAPGIRMITKVAEDYYVVPEEMDFLPYRYGSVKLAEGRDFHDIAKQAASTVTIRSDRQCYSMEGDPLNKVASQDRNFIGRSDAEFLLVSMGLHPNRAKAKIAEADLHGSINVPGLSNIRDYDEVRAEVVENRVLPLLEGLPKVGSDFLKEAATISDDNTVDAVLALNFINPENVSVFLDNIPDFEKAASHLAELYVASQLGLSTVSEDAVGRAMFGVDSVLSGLKSIEDVRELH